MAKRKMGNTREKLLAAASQVFVEKGFRDATVAEICKQADANISAVNYYFGSKEALYQETWRHAFAESIKAHPPNGGVSATAPVEERLRGHVRALIERIADNETNREFFISQMEFANPTGLLKEVMHSALIPLHEKTKALMEELIGKQASDKSLDFCEICILSMCYHPFLIQRIHQRMKNTEGPAFIDDLATFTDHVMTFALAGIDAVGRASRNAGTPPGPAAARRPTA
jgi:AcrR family transcriptional regulator